MNSNVNMADRMTAAVLFLLGLGMAWGGFEMDRLEIRRIHPSSIPGLVPMILGACLMICAAFLAMGTRSQSPADAPAPDRMDRKNWADFGFVAGWSCVFAVFMVGSLPFMVAAAIYVGVFSIWFLWPQSDGGGARLKMVALVVLYAVLIAAGVSTLFQDGFLVRLP